MNLDTFSVRISRLARGIDDRATAIVRKATLSIHEELASSTPVDKGVARSNWQVAIGEGSPGMIPAYAPGRHLGIEETANLAAALTAARLAVGNSRTRRGFSIFNNASYIGRLNNGYSDQAPAGFIEQAITRGVQKIESADLLVETDR